MYYRIFLNNKKRKYTIIWNCKYFWHKFKSTKSSTNRNFFRHTVKSTQNKIFYFRSESDILALHSYEKGSEKCSCFRSPFYFSYTYPWDMPWTLPDRLSMDLSQIWLFRDRDFVHRWMHSWIAYRSSRFRKYKMQWVRQQYGCGT